LLRREQHHCCFLMTLQPVRHHNQSGPRTTAALILTRCPGWISLAIIIRRRVHSRSRQTFTISKGESSGAPISAEWARTIEATGLHLAHPAQITESCRENTSRRALHRPARLPIYDSRYFRGRLPLRTKSTIFILRLRLQGCSGWFQFLKGRLTLAQTGRRQRSRWQILR
jgi:hypothetical protein